MLTDKKTSIPQSFHTIDNSDTSIINFINQVLNDAVIKRASDIHFESCKNFCRIRFRIDGLLHEITKTPLQFAKRFSTRLKIIANLDIAEKRLPQDGRFSLRTDDQQERDCRLSTCPTMFGEKLVVRILNPIDVDPTIGHLGFTENEMGIFKRNIQMPQGMILVTGPTGSGKTTTLYSAINALNQTIKNISTVEDPVEINLDGINQVEINHKIGLSFANVLRSFLRQDPDIIMIGEIRDLETAEIAIKAAYTGHLVLATLHTNSAVASINRLLNMGIAPFDLATAINLIIAQRLIRKLCPHCKKPKSLPESILIENNLPKNSMIYTATGCQYCENGYHERIAVFEMLPINSAVSDLMMNRHHQNKIYHHMHQLKCTTLREAALAKVRSGITSLEEINRVIK